MTGYREYRQVRSNRAQRRGGRDSQGKSALIIAKPHPELIFVALRIIRRQRDRNSHNFLIPDLDRLSLR